MQSVDAFERSSPRQPATAASTPNDAIENVAWAGAADQLLGLLARAACEAQQPVRPPAEMAAAYPPSPNKRGASTAGGRATGPDATAASPALLHYALMAFCKLWLLTPRRSSEKLPFSTVRGRHLRADPRAALHMR